MTHAIRFHQTGGPEVLKWEPVDVGDPGPGNPVKGQVFIHPSVTGGVLTQLVQR